MPSGLARLVGRPTCVVHGNPTNPNNIRITTDRVGLIDWDESHLDVADLDLALAHNAANLDAGTLDTAAQASAAWEAAVCWGDDYAAKRLAEVRADRTVPLGMRGYAGQVCGAAAGPKSHTADVSPIGLLSG